MCFWILIIGRSIVVPGLLEVGVHDPTNDPGIQNLKPKKNEKNNPETGSTYCSAGALCLPPSKPGGNTVYVAFAPAPPINPRFSARVPTVPACEEVWNPGSRAQHSSVEWLFRALMTVMLRVVAEVGIGRRERRTERRRGFRCMV